MIDWAGLGVCMANGADTVKEAANVVTPWPMKKMRLPGQSGKYVLGEV